MRVLVTPPLLPILNTPNIYAVWRRLQSDFTSKDYEMYEAIRFYQL
jgi:hypothetical protein